MNTQELLSGIGKAADDLALGVMEIDTSEVVCSLEWTKGRYVEVTIRAQGYGPVDGEIIRAVIRPYSERP